MPDTKSATNPSTQADDPGHHVDYRPRRHCHRTREDRRSAARPADFDAFWTGKLDELAVPAEPVLESVPSGIPEVDYWKITMNNIRGTKIRGQLARPAASTTQPASSPRKYPALLIVQWAGVYPLAPVWVTDRAKRPARAQHQRPRPAHRSTH